MNEHSLVITNESPEILKRYYGVTVIKSLLDVNVAKNAIKTLEQTDDENLALATINYIFVAIQDLCTSVGPYVPIVCPVTLNTLMSKALSKLSDSKYLDLIGSGHLSYCISHAIDCTHKCGYNSKTVDSINNCRTVLTEIQMRIDAERAFKVGHDIGNSEIDNIGLTSGNILLAKTGKLDVEINDDLRCGIFTDLTDKVNLCGISRIETAAKNVLASIETNVDCKGVIEGAEHSDPGAEQKIKNYISEVVTACSNVGSVVESFNKTNYDLDCYVTEDLTSENYVPDVTNNSFGWMHESLVLSNVGQIHAITENILGMNEGTLKEDILLVKRNPEDDNVNHAYIDPDEPLTISGKNFQYVLGAATHEKDYTNRKAIAERLAEAFINTIKWESVHEEYSDIPALTLAVRSKQILENLVKNTTYGNNLEETWRIVSENVKEELECVQQGTFNPTPTINSITPAPVGIRATQLAFNDVIRAETDEEMDSAMMELAKACNMLPTEEDATMESKIFSTKDYEHKVDAWKPGAGHNILFVTGLSGSGKSVTSYVKSYENNNAEVFSLKWIFYPENVPTYGLGEYVRNNIRFSDASLGIISWQNMEVKIINTIIEYANKNPDKLFIVDGAQLSTINGNRKILSYPILIKGTSVSKSIMQRISRDGLMRVLSAKSDGGLIKQYKDEEERIKKLKASLESCIPESMIFESSKVGKAARAASRKVQNAEEKVIRKQGGAVSQVKSAIKNAVDPMEKYINQMFQKIKKADADERRAILVKGGALPKIRRWVKRSIGLAAGAAIGTVIPVAATLTGIALIGFIATDKMLDAKEKRKLLRELEDEITIVNEKIDDSRSDENKQNKYNLMRIRNDLQRTIDRVRLNLKE